MSPDVITERLPWQDRWTRPTFDQLLQPHDKEHRELLLSLVAGIEALDGVQRSLTWYGQAWKWTFQFNFYDEAGHDVEVLAYLVPNPQSSLLCVPLLEPMISQFPIRRLNKFVRTGIQNAKQAVEIHWAVWSPTTQAEADHLLDLLNRKHKILAAAASSK